MTTALVLRVCAADGSSSHGFKWPLEIGSTVKAPDWTTEAACGHGLHGWLYGQGGHSCTDLWAGAGAAWMVLEVAHETMIDLGGKSERTKTLRSMTPPGFARAFMEANP